MYVSIVFMYIIVGYIVIIMALEKFIEFNHVKFETDFLWCHRVLIGCGVWIKKNCMMMVELFTHVYTIDVFILLQWVQYDLYYIFTIYEKMNENLEANLIP